MKGNDNYEFIISLGMRAPFFVVAIIGLIVALQRRDRHPKASNYVMLASIGLMLEVIVSMVFFMLLPKADLRGESHLMAIRGANCCFNTIDALLTGLLIAAAFADRRDPNARPNRPNRWDRGPIDEPTVLEEEPRRDDGQRPPSTGFRDRPQ